MPDKASYVRVATADEIKTESSRVFDVAGQRLLVCHSKGQYFAVAERCSHADETLEGGKVRAGKVVCPVHGARFDLSTGAAVNPPASRPIRTYPVRLVDGWIEVAIG